MDAGLKQRWVEALRSGEYVQGKAYLEHFVGQQQLNCCLGVLCNLTSMKKDKTENTGQCYSGPTHSIFEYDGNTSIGTPTVEMISSWNIPQDIVYELVSMNDNQGKNFFEIADYIEDTL